jgi:hypothetical protein
MPSSPIRLLLLTALVSLAGIPTHADTTPTYLISGIIQITGNNTCTPAPCSEAVAFSFDLGYQEITQPNPQYDYYDFTDTNFTSIWTGDIGSPALGGGRIFDLDPGYAGCYDYMEMFDVGGDEADIGLCTSSTPTPEIPLVSYGDLYHCETAACASEFPYESLSAGSPVLEDVSITPIDPTPEPPTIILMGLGILGLTFWSNKRSRTKAPRSLMSRPSPLQPAGPLNQ